MKHIKLLKPHTDAGKDYAENDVIVVDEITARWLVTMKIGVDAKPEIKTKEIK